MNTIYQHDLPEALIESMDQEGRGVSHVDGKTIFIEGALTGERVKYKSSTKKTNYEFANQIQILKPSNQRVTPKCPHYGRCGGCALQHMDANAQVAAKQRMLESTIWHMSHVRAENILPPLYGPFWGYRHKARLRARYVPQKGRVLVGFNEKSTRYVADMNSCEVLPPHVSKLIVPLQETLVKLSIRDAIPQIELAVGEDNVTILVVRIMEPLTTADEAILETFADTYQVQIWTQSKGPDTVKPLYPLQGPMLQYTLPEYDLRYPFSPTEFTQVNPYINRVMIRRAMQLLQPQAGERIADFFCGLGNFTLPIARSGAQVQGYEGSSALIKRAYESAEINGLKAKVFFKESDLFLMTPDALKTLGAFDKWLIDPPRDGAMELIKSLPAAEEAADWTPERIVYVSCNPGTLARDTGLLVLQKGYVLKACGVINMFPHTSHVESIAVFEKVKR